MLVCGRSVRLRANLLFLGIDLVGILRLPSDKRGGGSLLTLFLCNFLFFIFFLLISKSLQRFVTEFYTGLPSFSFLVIFC